MLLLIAVVVMTARMVMVMIVEQTWPLEEDLYPTSRMPRGTLTTFRCNYSRYVVCASVWYYLVGTI